jgi:hypothetical protein
VIVCILGSTSPARAADAMGSICRDGSWTASEGSGTCSHHGGVAQAGVDGPGLPPSPVPLPSPTEPSPLTPPRGVVLPKAVTPGAIDPRVTQANVRSTICRAGYTATVRPSSSYTTRLKRQQLATTYADFGDKRTGSYEEDHLISLELGGSPTDPRNLWPEPYAGATGARVKDRVENRLHAMVCAGSLSLAAAQAAIATNWWDAYRRYVD